MANLNEKEGVMEGKRSNWVTSDWCVMALSEESAHGWSLVSGCSCVVVGNCKCVCMCGSEDLANLH